MKFLKSAIIGLAGVAGIMMATSCDDYLDVNDDPNNAGSQDASISTDWCGSNTTPTMHIT